MSNLNDLVSAPRARWVIRVSFTKREKDECSEGKRKSDIYFSFSVHSVRVCVSQRDKEWSRFRLMACLVCSTKSAQMLRSEKMTLLTSSVSFLSRGETPSPRHYPDTPTELYHADENLTPLNLIKASLAQPGGPLRWSVSSSCPRGAERDHFISRLKGIP